MSFDRSRPWSPLSINGPKAPADAGGSAPKSLGNTDANGASKNVSDLVVWGDGDAWKLLGKASSKAEGWMKSTKAMEIPGVDCLVQVTTQQGSNVAEALQFVPGVRIEEALVDPHLGEYSAVRARRLVRVRPDAIWWQS